MKPQKQKEENFEKIVKYEQFANFIMGTISMSSFIFVLFFIQNTFLSGFLITLNFFSAVMNFVSHFSKENRKVYWRKIK